MLVKLAVAATIGGAALLYALRRRRDIASAHRRPIRVLLYDRAMRLAAPLKTALNDCLKMLPVNDSLITT